ncbi:MAG: CHASE2 domain-containing protein [Deltaproteobacteria bacterium]|nr:MAG: CHASE2 domain-containing protein [Deltaproteobacteria bacterium]
MFRFLSRLRRAAALAGDRIGARLQRNFFVYLAILFTAAALIDAATFNYVVGMRQKAFDAMVRNRLVVAPPADDIVIVDIDERSLAAMAGDYGRWPWPRQVLGEFVEKIAPQRPKAVVFDILFSDADLFNPDSDAYFNEVVAATGNTWFPLVRLDPAQDPLSQLPVDGVPGVRPAGDMAGPPMSIAVILPHFPAVRDAGRVGFNNIWPDPDGIVREYTLRRDEHGFELPSLALAVARGEDPALTAPDRLLINWRGEPFRYPYVSFADLYRDLQREHPTRPAGEFTGKIVIIGSTAPSLFDIKATAVSRQFPGVEILATAIDNLRRGDWLRVPDLPFFYLAITLVILWGTAWAFYRHGASGKLDRVYGLSQFVLIAVAYAAINLANVYINLTGPVMFGFAYYSLARYYAFATARALDASVVARRRSGDGARGCLLLLRFDLPTREEAGLQKLAEALQARCGAAPSAEWISGRQRGLWRLMENTLVLCWLTASGDDRHWQTIRAEADAVAAALPEILQRRPFDAVLPHAALSLGRAEGELAAGDRDWRALLGAALQQMQGAER